MSTTYGRIAVGSVIAFWLGLIFFLSGGRIRLFTIALALALLSLPSQALASCTDTIVYLPDGKTMLCRTCGGVTNCF